MHETATAKWRRLSARTAEDARIYRRALAADAVWRRVGPGYHASVGMREMPPYGGSFEPIGKQPIVLLKTTDEDRFLPIWIGHAEAAAILMKLQGATPPRPMTHDLLTDVVSELKGEVVKVTVTELRENTYFARITIVHDGQ